VAGGGGSVAEAVVRRVDIKLGVQEFGGGEVANGGHVIVLAGVTGVMLGAVWEDGAAGFKFARPAYIRLYVLAAITAVVAHPASQPGDVSHGLQQAGVWGISEEG